ncbi:MAG: amidohydrolase family protein [Clostridia bacterium]|nr:amidohydrolase family protein [Clostridia bacterium]
MQDILLIGGKYPDFEKREFVQANVAVKDGKITYIGADEPAAAEKIDCSGKVISPGFIDIHMHEENVSEGDKWVIAEMMLKQGVTFALGGNCGVMRQPAAEFKEMIKRTGGCPINYGLLSGYNYYRNNVLGIDHDEPASKEDRDKIAGYMRKDIEEGAFGISFGIEYDPGITTEEMKYAMQFQGDGDFLVSAHYRGDAAKAPEAVREMIELQNATGKKFQISHLSSCSAMGQMDEVLEMIEKAAGENPRLDFDTYPYNAFSTMMGSEVFQDGCLQGWGKDYNDVLLTEPPYENVLCTKEIFDDARKNYPDMLAVVFAMNEDEIAAAVSHRLGMVASDGIISNGKGHPRAAGTFPRFLGKYVREEKRLTLMEALEKITLRPATRLGMENFKGVIKEGADADITVFDPETILDGPTFEDINIENRGIDCVIVGGRVSLFEGKPTGVLAGRFVRKSK